MTITHSFRFSHPIPSWKIFDKTEIYWEKKLLFTQQKDKSAITCCTGWLLKLKISVISFLT